MVEVKIPIIIKKSLKDKIDWLSTNYENEIGGWITGTIKNEGIVLDDLLIPEQEVGDASVDMNGKQIAKLRKEFGKKCERIIAEWHSHNTMGSFWSTIDENLIEQVMKPRKIFMFIVSSKGEHKIRLEIRKPFYISVDDMEYEVEADENVKKELEKEIKKKITEKSYKTSKSSYSGYGYNHYDDSIGGFPFNHTAQEERFERDDEMKDAIKRILKYNEFDKSVTVKDMPWYYADSIMQEFQDHKPEMISCGDSLHYSIKFSPDNKEKAIDLMKDLREWVRMILNEELGSFIL